MNFTVSADHRVKIKESEKINKYIDFAREQKKLWKMKVTVIPIVVGALGTVHKETGKEIGGTRDQRKNQDHPYG